MERRELLEEIAERLMNNDLIDIDNFGDADEATEDVVKTLERALDGYLIVRGEII